ncbi:hypothetical protein [Sedimentibacter sp.]|uniref:hypothetical protein n=1 Tax=Sedimentibacter sp. TaxID=1960295 RepID=UPI0028AC5A02|nr:hypothetical protein [Sedimentibacter sp.]
MPLPEVLPYIVLVYSLVLSLFASGQNIPGWMLWLSPFGKLPFVSYESFQPIPALLLLGIGILFVTAGFLGFFIIINSRTNFFTPK